MSRRAVFLDRDGVINSYVYNSETGTVDSPASPEAFTLLFGVGEAIGELNRMGLLVVVVSNQPGIAKGRFSYGLLEAVTRKMEEGVQSGGGRIDRVYYCLHHPEASLGELRVHCECRKPAPGLLLQAAAEWDIDLSRSYMVGDGIHDILAGKAAGTTTIFLSPQKCYVCNELSHHAAEPDYMTDGLSSATQIIREIENAEKPSATPVCVDHGKQTEASSYSRQYCSEAISILRDIDIRSIERLVELLVALRERQGRLFLLGVGGGAGHASHAVCDFRKICGIESYAPSDNVSELTARINDDGWETAYANWLRGSHLSSADMVLVFSVGGGDAERNVSTNLVRALQYSRHVGASIGGVVGRNGGFTAQVADACVLIRVQNPATVTPHTEAFQALVWHLVVSHPRLKASETKWESVVAAGSTS
jgi:D-sedoheptulose 7-phosphate isomerase